MKTIFSEWKSYRQQVLPPDCSVTQAQETKRAFYAGSSAMFEWQPMLDKCVMLSELENLVGWIPDAYKQGFPHFNCGKRCVRAGISHFVHLYHVDRPAFTEWANEEILTNQEFRNRGIESKHGGFSILRDRRGGITKPLSLTTLATRIEAGEKFPTDEWGGCGCGTTN